MPGDEPWLIKFDGVRPAGDDGTVRATGPGTADGGPQPLMRIEHAYSELARRAGLDVPETRLLHERGYAHFMSRRFDRVHGGRVHQHTLGGVLHLDYQRPAVCSYEQYLRTVRDLGLDERSLDEAFRRAVFNVAAVNQDDHVKNFSFLMDRSGAWRLSPAYDLTFSRGHGWTRYHQMTIRGKRDGITRADLESLADEFGIAHSGAGIIDAVMDALGDWEDVAGAVDVPGPVIQSIREELRRRGLARDPAPAGARGTTSDHSGAIDDS
jgi:serine/threonine-protein kinase HipA